MSVTIQCTKRSDNMSSLRPNNEDARRKSPRKSAEQMPQYLARDYKHKRGKGGKKLGGGGTKMARERGGKAGSPRRTIIVIPVLQYQGSSQGVLQLVVVERNRQNRVSPRRTMIVIQVLNQGVEQ
jgi:hypothetical protein